MLIVLMLLFSCSITSDSCDSMDYSPPGPSFHGISQARICSVWVTQSCLTLCDPVDCSPLGSSVHRIPQARMLEWVDIVFSRESFRPLANTAATSGKGWSQVQLKYKRRRREFSFLMVAKSQIEIPIVIRRERSVAIFAASTWCL